MLMLGSAFAALFLLTGGQLLLTRSPGLGGLLRAGLALTIMLAFAPLLALHLAHERRRVLALEVDPTGLTLATRRGEVRLPYEQLAEAGVRGHAVFRRQQGTPGRRPPAGACVAELRLRQADGRRWEFAAIRVQDVLDTLAWLHVLAPGATRLPPSALAARHRTASALRDARLLLLGAIGIAGAGFAAQLAAREGLAALDPMTTLAFAATANIAACVAYAISLVFQQAAVRNWLHDRGLSAGPPVPEGPREPPPPTAEAAATAR
jgi:hypothetical protein